MPTARELLEQADALMRRNRVDGEDDIPVLTDAVPSVAEAPMPAAPMTLASAVAAARPPPAPAAVVAAETPAALEPEPLIPAEHEGEPSAWLEFEDAEPSVIGDAPDSVVIVPPFEAHPAEDEARRASDDALLQSAEHEEIELTTPPEEDEFAEDAVGPASVMPDATDDGAPSPSAGPIDPPRMPAPADISAPAQIPASASFVGTDSPAASASGETTPDTLATWTSTPAAAAAAAAGQASPPPDFGPDDRAHWDSVAEEIRMQVLQRIDLFTDTGLREQLGARLKPIVDRASADLVTTINQHVGELLRAYVAEAIEREIERWRRDN
jgi:hypothetical protein